MNYVMLALILVVCGGAYYGKTQQDQKIASLQQQLADQSTKQASLQADNEKLTASLADANAKLVDSTAKLSDSTTKLTAALAAEAATSSSPVPAAAPAAPVPAAAPAAAATATPPTVPDITPAQLSQGIIVIKGDSAEGTGFLVKMSDGPAIITNLHVLSNNPHLKFQTSAGILLTPTAMKGAQDRDLAELSIADGPYTYLPLASDVTKSQPGDAVLTPGNSQGGDVVLSTNGKLLAVGPDRVEFDNPIYHGNSGGPVFDSKSGNVVGVVTEAMKVDISNDLDKTSYASRNSAIASSMRYFGLRLDNIPKWEPYDMRRFQNETAFLDQVDKQSRSLDSFLNSSSSSNSPNQAAASEPEPYLSDKKIMAAADSFHAQLGMDTASRIDALRQLTFALDTLADDGVSDLSNPSNFYTFDYQRASVELRYRQALKKEIQDFGNDVNRIGSLPREH